MKNKIIFIAPSWSIFIRDDIKALEEFYEVQVNIYDWRTKVKTPANLLRQLFFLLLNINKASNIIVSFAGYWSLLPALFGKLTGTPVYIILHGTDAVSFPELNYGNLRKGHLRFVIRKSCQWADRLLPVSDALISYTNTYYSDKPVRYGIRHHLGELNTGIQTIHNGLDPEKWFKRPEIEKKEHSFLSVLSHGQLLVKGADLILEVADEFPNCTFYLAGINDTEGLPCPANVRCLGRLTPTELQAWYSRIPFYLQLSAFEGFGMALCEAMLCQCIPIGSEVNEIPSIIGDSGYILKSRSPEKLKRLLEEVLNQGYNSEHGAKAREQITKNYPLRKRMNRMRSLLKAESS